jgi:hypothetical protein
LRISLRRLQPMTSLYAVPQSSQAEPVSRPAAIEVPDRYELKYVIPEWQAEVVRRAIAPFCVLDPSSAEVAGHSYAIQSLYLDTMHRDLYRVSCEGRPRRWKARIRRYDGSDTVFLEVKNKDYDMVRKERARIPAAKWLERVRGLTHENACSAERIFCDRVERYQLVRTLMVRYLREAWISTVDSYARVTFDREVVCRPCGDWSLDSDGRDWLPLDSPASMLGVRQGVVLELKCLQAVPRWLSRVAQEANLERARFSKYCRGIKRVWASDALQGSTHPM